mmetsp:Transcript_8611/g.26412  ORF Transcript_8611/g.26412 Transcript_8611/m.26412 type:complete len:653 (+) Transcript_8611:1360-3318(+)
MFHVEEGGGSKVSWARPCERRTEADRRRREKHTTAKEEGRRKKDRSSLAAFDDGKGKEQKRPLRARKRLLGFEEAVGLDDGAGMPGRLARRGIPGVLGGRRPVGRGGFSSSGEVVVVDGLAFDDGGEGFVGVRGEGGGEARGEDGGDGGADVDGVADDEFREHGDEPGAVAREGLRVEALDDVEGVEGERRRGLGEVGRRRQAVGDGGLLGGRRRDVFFRFGVLVQQVAAELEESRFGDRPQRALRAQRLQAAEGGAAGVDALRDQVGRRVAHELGLPEREAQHAVGVEGARERPGLRQRGEHRVEVALVDGALVGGGHDHGVAERQEPQRRHQASDRRRAWQSFREPLGGLGSLGLVVVLAARCQGVLPQLRRQRAPHEVREPVHGDVPGLPRRRRLELADRVQRRLQRVHREPRQGLDVLAHAVPQRAQQFPQQRRAVLAAAPRRIQRHARRQQRGRRGREPRGVVARGRRRVRGRVRRPRRARLRRVVDPRRLQRRKQHAAEHEAPGLGRKRLAVALQRAPQGRERAVPHVHARVRHALREAQQQRPPQLQPRVRPQGLLLLGRRVIRGVVLVDAVAVVAAGARERAGRDLAVRQGLGALVEAAERGDRNVLGGARGGGEGDDAVDEVDVLARDHVDVRGDDAVQRPPR